MIQAIVPELIHNPQHLPALLDHETTRTRVAILAADGAMHVGERGWRLGPPHTCKRHTRAVHTRRWSLV